MKEDYVWVLILPCILVTLVRFSFPVWKGNRHMTFLMWEKSCQFKVVDWFKTPPPNLNSQPCNLFSTCFCCHQGQSCSWPHKGLSLRLKSSPHKILFEINSVTFTMQRQMHCQTHPDWRHCVKQVFHIFINQSSVSDIEEVKTSSCSFFHFKGHVVTFVEESFDWNI